LQNTGKIDDFQRLTENENITLLQILAGAPCLVCGHEQRPAVGSLGSQPKPGMSGCRMSSTARAGRKRKLPWISSRGGLTYWAYRGQPSGCQRMSEDRQDHTKAGAVGQAKQL
jgi:hypothetical protein